MEKIPKTQLSDHLPKEIMEEILSRVDVKSLLRYRCVSKSYRSLIDSKHFIKIHHKKSTRDTTLVYHRVLFLSDTRSPKPKVSGCSLLSFIDSSSSYTAPSSSNKAASELNSAEANLLSFIDPSSFKASELNSLLISFIEPSSYIAASELNFPTNYDTISFVGCCNGLVCILLERDNNIGSQFILWNPCTRISRKVPHIDKNKMVHWCDFTCYGFGWDESSDDYKIVAIVKVEGQSQTTSIAKIYSLRCDSWKQNDGWDGLSRSWYVPCLSLSGVLTTGKLQWERADCAKSDDEWELVAFDLKREVFQMIEQPFYFDDFDPLLGTFGECLSMQLTYDDYIEIWVMKEYGVKESWEKVMVLYDLDGYGIWTFPSVTASYNGGIGIGKGGEIILMDVQVDEKYLAYNQKNKCIYYTPVSINQSKIYIESLVSPLNLEYSETCKLSI